MSHADFKKWPCSHLEFNVQEPLAFQGQVPHKGHKRLSKGSWGLMFTLSLGVILFGGHVI